MKTLREVLSPFMSAPISPEKFMEMRTAVDAWAEATGNIVYPVSVDPPLARATNNDVVTFDITFECVPKAQVHAGDTHEDAYSKWMSLMCPGKPTNPLQTK